MVRGLEGRGGCEVGEKGEQGMKGDEVGEGAVETVE